MKSSMTLDERIQFHMVVDGENRYAFDDLHKHIGVVVHGVPTEYQPKKARFKARALEWFRINQNLQKDDWVLHLDEETYVDDYGIKTCLDVIERSSDISIAQASTSCTWLTHLIDDL